MIPKGELLIEFFGEEIPARMQSAARADLERLLTAKLAQRGLTFSRIETYVTPRRLAIVAIDLLLRQEDRIEEKRGPRVDAPEQAIQGFLQSTGLKSIQECEQRDSGKGVFLFAHPKITGQDAAKILPAVIDEVIAEFPWPKSMRWSCNTRTWVRPLQSILCILAGKTVEGSISFGRTELQFTDVTFGHRFMQPQPFKVKNFTDYKTQLASAYVILDQDERRKIIKEQSNALAILHGLTLKDDEALLEEVTGLVEWPVALLGSIDPAFMHLPPEVLVTSMRVHQKYFALQNSGRSLAPNFIVIANIEAEDGGKTLVAGNEKVLRARLSDAAFFYDQDRKKTLSEHAQGLKTTVFHGRLGTMADKAERLAKLAGFIAQSLKSDMDSTGAERAALLCKADLTTSMVGEFPELQGIMGAYYARNDGEDEAVAQAIGEHYRPRGPQDELPGTYWGKIIALADKVDTLAGFFAVGIKPTGSKDPFALRRTALGCIRLLEESSDLTLGELLSYSYDLYNDVFEAGTVSKEVTVEDLQAFFVDRLTVYWRDQGFRYDIVRGVLSKVQEASVYLLRQRLQALQAFITDKNGKSEDLLGAYRRACNILAIEEKKDRLSYGSEVNENLLAEVTEQSLYAALQENMKETDACLKRNDFAQALAKIAFLRPDIDAFFENVTVNSEDKNIRSNRLKLLCLMRSTLEQVADFSQIE